MQLVPVADSPPHFGNDERFSIRLHATIEVLPAREGWQRTVERMRIERIIGTKASSGSATDEEADDELNFIEDELSAEFNSMIAETRPVDVEIDDLHEGDWIFDEDDSDERSDEFLPEVI